MADCCASLSSLLSYLPVCSSGQLSDSEDEGDTQDVERHVALPRPPTSNGSGGGQQAGEEEEEEKPKTSAVRLVELGPRINMTVRIANGIGSVIAPT